MSMYVVNTIRNLLIMIGLCLFFVGASAAIPGQELLVVVLIGVGIMMIGAAAGVDWLADRYLP